METFQVQTDDGHTLVVKAYRPHGVVARRVVVIAAALGVPQVFYERYAAWLVQQGCVVYTFDWRGMAESAPPNLRHYRAKLIDWALHDAPTIMALVAQRHPELPISWFGHSMGGILWGAMPQHPQIDRVVTMGSGSGYKTYVARPLRHVMGVFWHVLVPLSVARHGYFAGQRLRAVGDLPRGIVAQWKRWCASPDFVMSEGEAVRQAYAAVTVPITAVLFTDDNMASPEGIRAVHAPYTQAPVQYLTLSPKDVGARAVGHFHFFHPRTGPQGWRASLPWLGLA